MLLEIVDLYVKYGNIEVLHGINLKVREGEIVTILGANGAGKSTTLLSISGLVKPSSGAIYFNKNSVHKMAAHAIVKQGIAQVPEGRRVFGTLTVQENMNLGAFVCADPARAKKTQEWIYELFPVLAERRQQLSGTLSGGGAANAGHRASVDEPTQNSAPGRTEPGACTPSRQNHFSNPARNQRLGRHHRFGGTECEGSSQACSPRLRP